jgi:hypothetical protein
MQYASVSRRNGRPFHLRIEINLCIRSQLTLAKSNVQEVMPSSGVR